MKQSLSLSIILGLAFVAACTDDPEEDPVSDDTVFSETVVELLPDGTVVVGEPRLVTAGEQRAQNELRRAIEAGELEPPPAIVEDRGCWSDSFWFYARTDWTGPKLCLRGVGGAILASFPRYTFIGGQPVWIGTWQISSGSYWPGSETGEVDGTGWYQLWSGWGARQRFFQPNNAEVITLFN